MVTQQNTSDAEMIEKAAKETCPIQQQSQVAFMLGVQWRDANPKPINTNSVYLRKSREALERARRFLEGHGDYIPGVLHEINVALKALEDK